MAFNLNTVLLVMLLPELPLSLPEYSQTLSGLSPALTGGSPLQEVAILRNLPHTLALEVTFPHKLCPK